MNTIKYIQAVGVDRAYEVLFHAPESGQPLYLNTVNQCYFYTGYQNTYFYDGVWGGVDVHPHLQNIDIQAVSLTELDSILKNFEKVLNAGGVHGFKTYCNGELTPEDLTAINQYIAIEPIPDSLMAGAKRYINNHSPNHIQELLTFAPEGAELYNNAYIRNVCSEGYIDHFARWNGAKWLKAEAHREYVNEAVSIAAIQRLVDSGAVLNTIPGQLCEQCNQVFEEMSLADDSREHPEPINLVIPFIKKYTLDVARNVATAAPIDAEYYHPEDQYYVANIDGEQLEIAEAEPKVPHLVNFDRTCTHKYESDCDCVNGWTEDSAWIELINVLVSVGEIKRVVEQIDAIKNLGGVEMVQAAITTLQHHAETAPLSDLQQSNLEKYQQWLADYTAILAE